MIKISLIAAMALVAVLAVSHYAKADPTDTTGGAGWSSPVGGGFGASPDFMSGGGDGTTGD